MSIDLQALFTASPQASDQEIENLRALLTSQSPAFDFSQDSMAALAFGGTIQSAYIPSQENIMPLAINQAEERYKELRTQFGIADEKRTGAVLTSKDSRNITNTDILFLFHCIDYIPNKKIIVTCGTYMLPLIAKALDAKFGEGKSDKIIGVTGSCLPLALAGQDVDYNLGGVTAAVNAFAYAGKAGFVFVQFHGEIIVGEALHKLDLHPEGKTPRLARSSIDVQ